ncbi:MAG: hypothetical protein JNK05_41490 [Myxococcales bacterium]|nr:hypothetical protein [Myxococcales bacterium]
MGLLRSLSAASLASLAFVTSIATARAQGVPRACTGTSPATVATGGAITGLSAVAGSADALYVAYDAAAGTRRVVGLLLITGASGGQMAVNTATVGEGSIGRSGLVLVGSTLIGAYKRTNGTVVAFTRSVSGGAVTELAADSALAASSAPSVAVNGRNILISWAGSNGSSYLWTVSATGQPVGAARTVATNFVGLQSTGALGGAVIGAGSTAQVSLSTGRAPRAIAAIPAGATAYAVTNAGRTAIIASVASGTAHVTSVRTATDRGRTVSLGPAVGASHVAVAPTPWGGFALWPSASTLNLQALRPDGRKLGPSFAMGTFRATQSEAFSATAVGSVVYAFWAEGGNVQMLRIHCYS